MTGYKIWVKYSQQLQRYITYIWSYIIFYYILQSIINYIHSHAYIRPPACCLSHAQIKYKIFDVNIHAESIFVENRKAWMDQIWTVLSLNLWSSLDCWFVPFLPDLVHWKPQFCWAELLRFFELIWLRAIQASSWFWWWWTIMTFILPQPRPV